MVEVAAAEVTAEEAEVIAEAVEVAVVEAVAVAAEAVEEDKKEDCRLLVIYRMRSSHIPGTDIFTISFCKKTEVVSAL